MDSLDFVELEMKAGGFLDFAVELKNPDFAALAESAGILGLKAETAQDVRPMLQKAFEHDGPALVEEDTTTILIGASDRLRMTPAGNYLIDLQ